MIARLLTCVVTLAFFAAACGSDDELGRAPGEPSESAATDDPERQAPDRSRSVLQPGAAGDLARTAGQPRVDPIRPVHILGAVRVLPTSENAWPSQAPFLLTDEASIAVLGCTPGSSGCEAAGLAALSRGGVDIVALTGSPAEPELDDLADARDALVDAGSSAVGYGASIADAVAPAIVDTPSGAMAVHAISLAEDLSPEASIASPGLAGPTAIDALIASIEMQSESMLSIVVLVAWGNTEVRAPSSEHVEFAERLIGAGATVVAGSGSDHLQRFERIDEGSVLFDLGSAATVVDDPQRRDTAVLQLDLGDEGRPCVLPATASISGPSLDNPTDHAC
ncbi:MAG: CapA family protein [Acidimicrobiales bacterium]